MTILNFMRKFSDQPKPGMRVIVFMKDGTQRQANTCQVVSSSFNGLQWYDKKTHKAIDVNLIDGWNYLVDT